MYNVKGVNTVPERLRILTHLLRNWRPLLDGKAVVIIDNGGTNVDGLFGKSIPPRRLSAILDGFNKQMKRSTSLA